MINSINLVLSALADTAAAARLSVDLSAATSAVSKAAKVAAEEDFEPVLQQQGPQQQQIAVVVSLAVAATVYQPTDSDHWPLNYELASPADAAGMV